MVTLTPVGGWVQRECTAITILAACTGRSEGLVLELLKQEADLKARHEDGDGALLIAFLVRPCCCRHHPAGAEDATPTTEVTTTQPWI